MSGPKAKFQPMNVNYGLLPPIEDIVYKREDGSRIKGKDKTRFRKRKMSERALTDIMSWA
jgi:methylenetetrahydrofolate--tRNA-(uracil-5-)-methyltransferase